MSDQISIKVNIADRIFPLKVSIEEEEIIRKAADAINKKVKLYIDQYGIKDRQAALSMCALELSTELLNIETTREKDNENWTEKLLELEDLLDKSTIS